MIFISNTHTHYRFEDLLWCTKWIENIWQFLWCQMFFFPPRLTILTAQRRLLRMGMLTQRGTVAQVISELCFPPLKLLYSPSCHYYCYSVTHQIQLKYFRWRNKLIQLPTFSMSHNCKNTPTTFLNLGNRDNSSKCILHLFNALVISSSVHCSIPVWA